MYLFGMIRSEISSITALFCIFCLLLLSGPLTGCEEKLRLKFGDGFIRHGGVRTGSEGGIHEVRTGSVETCVRPLAESFCHFLLVQLVSDRGLIP